MAFHLTIPPKTAAEIYALYGALRPGHYSHSDTALYIPLVILHTKYAGWCQNDFNVHA